MYTKRLTYLSIERTYGLFNYGEGTEANVYRHSTQNETKSSNNNWEQSNNTCLSFSEESEIYYEGVGGSGVGRVEA